MSAGASVLQGAGATECVQSQFLFKQHFAEQRYLINLTLIFQKKLI